MQSSLYSGIMTGPITLTARASIYKPYELELWRWCRLHYPAWLSHFWQQLKSTGSQATAQTVCPVTPRPTCNWVWNLIMSRRPHRHFRKCHHVGLAADGISNGGQDGYVYS